MSARDHVMCDADFMALTVRIDNAIIEQRAKIVTAAKTAPLDEIRYAVGFHDGMRTVFNLLQEVLK